MPKFAKKETPLVSCPHLIHSREYLLLTASVVLTSYVQALSSMNNTIAVLPRSEEARKYFRTVSLA